MTREHVVDRSESWIAPRGALIMACGSRVFYRRFSLKLFWKFKISRQSSSRFRHFFEPFKLVFRGSRMFLVVNCFQIKSRCTSEFSRTRMRNTEACTIYRLAKLRTIFSWSIPRGPSRLPCLGHFTPNIVRFWSDGGTALKRETCEGVFSHNSGKLLGVSIDSTLKA